ncbi:aldo/keto reductase [Pontiella sulfatireligans]|uniref:General stress protein 69 n=1 Tax=Pontiella sulfatireligans TaxID=2750658 RepID=A0A6C2UUU5_9BACT|nr:aldo/keto reductase [Pontiella sulfatireligans]VGO22626.1 General stress protein 69 [Pontiella sulfatireligans]
MKRRELLQQLAVAGTALAPPSAKAGASKSDRLGSILPRRTLGKCGEQVTCLGLGGYHVGWPEDEAVAQATIEKAIEVGIRFFDNAESYGKGRSEERYGKYLIPKYRDDIFLMTKTQAKDAATARQHLEGSLRRMNTEVIDLWQIHSLKDPADADDRLAKGVLDEALKAQAEGKVRHIGFTGHASPYAHVRMTEHKAVLDACTSCQFPINPVDAASKHSFIETTIPKMLENNIGILAMKTLADGRFFAQKEMNGKVKWTSDKPVIPGALSVEECINFTLSLPVSVLITGAETPEFVEEKAAIVKRFTTLSEKQRLALAEKVAGFAEEGKVEYYKNKDLRSSSKTT